MMRRTIIDGWGGLNGGLDTLDSLRGFLAWLSRRYSRLVLRYHGRTSTTVRAAQEDGGSVLSRG